MKIFELKTPVMDKIKTTVDAYLASIAPAPARPFNFLYLDYEPDDGFIRTLDFDGAVVVYAAEIQFPPGSGSTTGTQDSDSTLIIDCYGFGDPISDTIDPEKFEPTTREAENRAQVLTTLSYKAIMDRVEIDGLPNSQPPQIKSFGTGMDIDEKFPLRIQKFPNMGTMDDQRGMCAFRSQYTFKIGEDVPSETLGPGFAGPQEITTETFNPGDEPE